jgi:hypothetical protein
LGACSNKHDQEVPEKNIIMASRLKKIPSDQKYSLSDRLEKNRQQHTTDSQNDTVQDIIPKNESNLKDIIKPMIDSCIRHYNKYQAAKTFTSYQYDINQDSFYGLKVAYVELSKETWSETIHSFSLDYFDENLLGFNKFWLINDSLLGIETYLLEASTTENGMQVQAILKDRFYYQNEQLIQTKNNPRQKTIALQRLNQWKTVQYKLYEKD